MNAILFTPMVVSLAAGAAFGVFYFTVLYRAVCLQAARAAATKIVLLTLLRAGAALSVFWIIALQGAMPLLMGLLGFLMARFLARRWVRSMP